MWTVANLVDRLKDKFDFAVVSRNHDGVGDRTPYSEVPTGTWTEFDGNDVYYVDPSRCSRDLAAKLIKQYRPDAIYVNSVFGLTTRVVLEARRKGLIGPVPVIIAPCGELSDQCRIAERGSLRIALRRDRWQGIDGICDGSAGGGR